MSVLGDGANNGLDVVRAAVDNGDDRDVGGAFTDRRPSPDPDCGGFRVRWSEDAPVARMRMPSSCLGDGDYGAVRFAVLTERGGDTDYAPGEPVASSDWIPRG